MVRIDRPTVLFSNNILDWLCVRALARSLVFAVCTNPIPNRLTIHSVAGITTPKITVNWMCVVVMAKKWIQKRKMRCKRHG